MAGYDLDLLARLYNSDVQILAVGDPRQGVYATNTANRNKKYRRAGIIGWIDEQVRTGLITKSALSYSYRCNQTICNYADSLYPDLPPTISANDASVEDAGVYLVHEDDLLAYRLTHGPQELRWDKRSKRAGANALNMGKVKGMAFDRVLIHPTKPIKTYIEKCEGLKPEARAKFYVAMTRARHSVAIVTNTRSTSSGLPVWKAAVEADQHG